MVRLPAYVCRGPNAWPGDIALSATHFPSTGFTYAVFFGCEFGTKPAQATALKSGDRITGLLSNSESTVAHPMLLVGIFAEIELRRHKSIVQSAVGHLLDTVNKVSAGEGADYRALAPRPGQEESHAIKPWLNMHVIKIKLEAWRRELEKMMDHVQELSQTLYQASEVVPREGDIDPLTLQPYTATQIAAFTTEEERRTSLRATGDRIKERLQDITNQYHEMISMSMLTMEGLAMATQLVSSTNVCCAIAANHTPHPQGTHQGKHGNRRKNEEGRRADESYCRTHHGVPSGNVPCRKFSGCRFSNP